MAPEKLQHEYIVICIAHTIEANDGIERFWESLQNENMDS